MKIVRNNVFETNSSSTHSLTICSKEEYDKWIRGELYYCEYYNQFYTNEERVEFLKNKGYSEEEIDAIINDNYDNLKWDLNCIPVTRDQYFNYISEYYEDFTESSKINGVDVVVFGYYGYND